MNPQEKTVSKENFSNEGTAALILDLPSIATFKIEPLLRFMPDPPINVDEETAEKEYIKTLTPVFKPPSLGRRSRKAGNDFISSPSLEVDDHAIVAKNKEVFPATLKSLTKIEGREENPPMSGLIKSKDGHIGKQSL
jgi:hypothetical protein